MLNKFPNEFRKPSISDSIVAYLPKGYRFARASYVNELWSYNSAHNGYTNYNQPQGNNTLIFPVNSDDDTLVFKVHHLYHLSDKLPANLASDSLTFYDENSAGILDIFITPTCKALAMDTVPNQYVTFTDGLLGNRQEPHRSRIRYQDRPIIKPSAVLTLPDTITTQAVKRIVAWNFNITNFSGFNANNSFVSVLAPSGNILIDSLVNKVTGKSVSGVKDTVKGSINKIYSVGVIPNNSQPHPYAIYGRFMCSKNNASAIDSIIVMYGSNCDGYPKSVRSSVCNINRVKYFLDKGVVGLEAKVIFPDTLHACDTIQYVIKSSATGVGTMYNLQTKVSFPSGQELKYIPGTGTLHFPDSVTTKPLNPKSLSPSTYVWTFDSLADPYFKNNGIRFGTPEENIWLSFKAVSSCAYNHQSLGVTVSGVSYCGDTITLPAPSPGFVQGNERAKCGQVCCTVVANAGNDVTICGGSPVIIGSAPQSGTTYIWKPKTGISDTTIANPVAAPLVTTTYIVTATKGGCSKKDTVIVNVNPAPKPNVSIPSPVCAGSEHGYFFPNSGVNYNIISLPPGSTFIGIGNAGGVILAVTYGSTSGNLVFRATNKSTGCTKDTSIFVNVIPIPQQPSVSGPSQVCASSTNDYSIPRVSGVNITLVSLPSGSTFTGFGNQFVTVFTVAFGSTSGNLVFRATNTATGCTRDTSIFVNVNPSAPQAVIGGPPGICLGSTSNVTLVANVSPGLTYTWTLNGNVIGGVFGPTISTPLPGLYTVIETNASGCSSTSNAFNLISINPPPIPTIQSCGQLSLCSGESTTLNSNPSSGYSYQWNMNGSIISAATNSSYTTSIAGVYTVKITSSNGCSSLSDKDTISVISACCHSYQVKAGSSFGSPTLGTPNLITTVDASTYPGAIVTFNGIYHIKGNLRLINGTFNFQPGTVLYFDGISCMKLTFCGAPITANNFPLQHNYMLVENATIHLSGATLTSTCDYVWGGVTLKNNSTIISQQGKLGNVTIPSEISQAFIALSLNAGLSGTVAYFCEPVANNRYYISNTNFLNNFAGSLYDYNTNTSLQNEGVTNSNFNSTSSTMRKPYQNGIAMVGMILGKTNYLKAKFNNNTFNNLAEGVVGNLNNATFKKNTFTNIWQFAFWVNADTGRVGTIDNNTIIVPDKYFTFGGVANQNSSVDGIIAGKRIVIINNTIKGSQTNPLATNKIQIGIRSLSDLSVYGQIIHNNTAIKNLDEGIRLHPVNNSNQNIYSNNFSNTIIGISVSSVSYSNPHVKVHCNTFSNPNNLTNIKGIYVQPNAFLNVLGGNKTPAFPDDPNGNYFKNYTSQTGQPRIVYNGTQASWNTFQYFLYNSIQEVPLMPLVSNINTPPSKPFSITGISPNGVCAGTIGVQFRLAATGSSGQASTIKQMKDSVRAKKGNEHQIRDYINQIIQYHQDNRNMDSLVSYVHTLSATNLWADNSLRLSLMEYYRDIKDEAKALKHMDTLLTQNPNDQEISHRAKFFDIKGRTGEVPSRMNFLSGKDSTDLSQMANSSSTISELGCLYLRFYYPQCTCNDSMYLYNPPVIRQADTSAFIVKPEAISYLQQSVPNPSAYETIIAYKLPDNAEKASIVIYDILGANKFGEYELDVSNNTGSILVDLKGYNSGVYPYSLIINGNMLVTRKMLVIK